MVSNSPTTHTSHAASGTLKPSASRPSIKLGKTNMDLWTLMGKLEHYTAGLTQKIESFWGIPVHCKLFSLSKEPVYFTQFHDAYVSQAALSVRDVELKGDMTLKLSSHLCSSLLTTVLGSRSNPTDYFTLSHSTTDFEKAILAEFNKDILEFGIKKMTRKKNPDILDHETLYLTWAVLPNVSEFKTHHNLGFKEKTETGFITIALQANALKIPETQTPEALSINPSFFDHALVEARLWLGTTKVHLSDLKQLEPSDTIVLDDSNINEMFLITGTNKIGDAEKSAFPVILKNKEAILIPSNKDMETMTQETTTQAGGKQNLWDNLMIDVSAEFEPVKIPLKQLKDMSQGLVVEVGDIVRNTVALNVEGKTLAKGTLVIVDNKFGLRVEEMVADSIGGEPVKNAATTTTPNAEQATKQTPQQEQQMEAAPQAPPQQAPVMAEDDDDFDIDIDDLTGDLDEDEWD